MANILLSVNIARFANLVVARTGLVQSLLQQGHKVTLLAKEDATTPYLKSLGLNFKSLSIDTNGINPLKDFRTVHNYYRCFKEIKPDLVINYTIKPVIYGGIVARLLGIPYISVLTGLGSSFIAQNWLTHLVQKMFYYSQRKATKVLSLNKEDVEFFITKKIVPSHKVDQLPEGIDSQHFFFSPLPAMLPLKFLFVGRVIADKGIEEYVEVAKQMKAQGSNVIFQVLGPVDVANQTAIAKEKFNAWIQAGLIEYLGATNDVRPYIQQAHCIVLPSYREGVALVLLEAAAMGRPIITTNAPGCRDVVEDGINGLLCEAKSSDSLYQAIIRLSALPLEVLSDMGKAGRKKVEGEFNFSAVLAKYQHLLAEVGIT